MAQMQPLPQLLEDYLRILPSEQYPDSYDMRSVRTADCSTITDAGEMFYRPPFTRTGSLHFTLVAAMLHKNLFYIFEENNNQQYNYFLWKINFN